MSYRWAFTAHPERIMKWLKLVEVKKVECSLLRDYFLQLINAFFYRAMRMFWQVLAGERTHLIVIITRHS